MRDPIVESNYFMIATALGHTNPERGLEIAWPHWEKHIRDLSPNIEITPELRQSALKWGKVLHDKFGEHLTTGSIRMSLYHILGFAWAVQLNRDRKGEGDLDLFNDPRMVGIIMMDAEGRNIEYMYSIGRGEVVEKMALIVRHAWSEVLQLLADIRNDTEFNHLSLFDPIYGATSSEEFDKEYGRIHGNVCPSVSRGG